MLRRSMETILQTALKISPVVLLKGARQVGKSTLAYHYHTNDKKEIDFILLRGQIFYNYR